MTLLYVAHKVEGGEDIPLGDPHPTPQRAHLALLAEIARAHPDVTPDQLTWVSEAYDEGEAQGLRRFGTTVERTFYEFYEKPVDRRAATAARTALAKTDFKAAQQDIRDASSAAELKAELLKMNRTLYRLAAALMANLGEEPKLP